MALDSGSGTLGPRVAIELGDWPVLMSVTNLKLEDGHATGLQYTDERYYRSSYPLPAVATVLETPERPRYAHSVDIMNAYRKRSVEVWSSVSLGLDPSTLPAPTTSLRLRLPPEREVGTILEGSPAEAAAALVITLRQRRIL